MSGPAAQAVPGADGMLARVTGPAREHDPPVGTGPLSSSVAARRIVAPVRPAVRRCSDSGGRSPTRPSPRRTRTPTSSRRWEWRASTSACPNPRRPSAHPRRRSQRLDHPCRGDPGPPRPGRVRVLHLPRRRPPPRASRRRPAPRRATSRRRRPSAHTRRSSTPLSGGSRASAAIRRAPTALGRLVVLAASALLLWLACWHLVRWLGPRSLVGVALLMTPMAVFCLGILNTSAVEILGAAGMAAVVAVYARRPESLSRTRHPGGGAGQRHGTGAQPAAGHRHHGGAHPAAPGPRRLARGVGRAARTPARSPGPRSSCRRSRRSRSRCGSCATTTPCCSAPGLSADSFRGFREQWMQLIQESIGWFGWLDVRPPVRRQPRLVRRGGRAGRHRPRPR